MNWEKTAVIFPGQGSQVLGMGKDFADEYPLARATFEQADEVLGFSLSRLCWAGPAAALNQTLHTQPALFVTSTAIWRVLRQLLPAACPAWMAGHSLGEFSALTAAGALAYDDGLRLVYARGSLMQKAGEDNPGAMAALLGLDIPQVAALCADVAAQSGKKVVIANDNCPGQVVVSGENAAVERLLELAAEQGARRAVKLAVSVAAHSPLMASAEAAFRAAVDATPFSAPQTAVYGNVDAKPLAAAADIRSELNQQLTQTVRWTESMQAIIGAGAENFVELGAGAVLSGLMRRIDRRKARFALNSVGALETFLKAQS